MNILGVGGHAKVIIDLVKLLGTKINAVYDDDTKTHGTDFCGFKVEGNINSSINGNSIIAIGNNSIRKEISKRVTDAKWDSVIHPSAVIAKDVMIGEGTVVMAGAVIQAGTTIGKHCIVNTGVCIDHDCYLEDFVHVAPNCGLAGGVIIGNGSFIGIGSSIVQYLRIGDLTTVGAGSVVINDLPRNCIAVGVPAKPIKYKI